MGLFGNMTGSIAATVMNKGNSGQQQNGSMAALLAAQRAMSTLGMGPVVNTNQAGTSSLFQAAIQNAQAKKVSEQALERSRVAGQQAMAVRQQARIDRMMGPQNINRNNINMNQLQPTPINPNAMSNMQALQDINGTQIPNTFNMSMGTPALGMDPSAQYVAPSAPVANPQNVQTEIMPNNNLQTY